MANIPIHYCSREKLPKILILLATALLTCVFVSLQSVESVPLSDYNRYQCATGSGLERGFDILTLPSRGVFEIADNLCQSAAFGQLFGSVSITWHARDFLNAGHIVNEEFDYFWNRAHVVEGLAPNLADYFVPILETPYYTLNWYSRFPAPELTAAYFADKRVGFLDVTNSQTYYLRPIDALNKGGVDLRDDQKLFFNDPLELMLAFDRGEIDIMTGPRFVGTDGVLTSPYYTLAFDNPVPSGNWYLRKAYANRDIICPLVDADVSTLMFHEPATAVASASCEGSL